MKERFFQPVDNAPLIVFRIFFGFLMACESFGAIITGWVKNVLITPKFTFSFIGFEWLQPLPGNGMYFYFALMGTFGLLIMLGFRYRIAIISFTLLWAGVYFMQKSAYNNHYYLVLLISFLMVFLPANKDLSLDTKFGKVKTKNQMPYWIIFLFICQVSFVYFYAAIAKFYPDWLDGTFTKNLLQGTTTRPFFLEIFSQKWFYLFIAYAGIAFDLFIVPFLLFKRTRTLALIASLVFHLFNSITLQIGIFPFFALTFALFFYPPITARKLFYPKRLKQDFVILPFSNSNKNVFYFLIIPYLIIQFALPLRHHFIAGDVLQTEEGHRMSWRMMLREKSGFIVFKVKDNTTNEVWTHNYYDDVTPKQASNLATKPDFIWQYCQRIKKQNEGKDISIFVDCSIAINRKEYRPLIDPKFDMAKAEWSHFKHNEWILLQE
jgi:vitamin K-dependent gamma-carboxylase